MDGARDEEIYQAVLAMRNAQEEGPINGRDADVEDELTTCALPYMSWGVSGSIRHQQVCWTSRRSLCTQVWSNFGLFRMSNTFGGIQVNVPHLSHWLFYLTIDLSHHLTSQMPKTTVRIFFRILIEFFDLFLVTFSKPILSRNPYLGAGTEGYGLDCTAKPIWTVGVNGPRHLQPPTRAGLTDWIGLMTHHKGSSRLGRRGLGQWRKLRILDPTSRGPLAPGSCIARPHTISYQRDLPVSRPILFGSIRVCDEAGPCFKLDGRVYLSDILSDICQCWKWNFIASPSPWRMHYIIYGQTPSFNVGHSPLPKSPSCGER